MRILMTTDAVGGVWQYSLELAGGLTRRGAEVVLAVLGPSPDETRQAEATAVPGVTLALTALPLDWLGENPAEVRAAGRALSRLADAAGADIVHLNSPALAANTLFRTPVVATIHSCLATWWAAVKTGPLPADFVWRTELMRAGLLAADAVAAPSGAFAKAVAEAYGRPAAPIVVHNGRTHRAGANALSQSGSFAFTAGRLWDEGKNIAALDRAAAVLDIPVTAAGPLVGPNGSRATFGHIEALGHLNDEAMRARLAARPIFVSAALYEPFGLAVLEAAQAGCPLVLSDIATFRELWDGAAVFVPPRDDRGFADAIARLARDEARRSELAEAARTRAGRYTVAAMTDGFRRIYGSVLSAPMKQAAVA